MSIITWGFFILSSIILLIIGSVASYTDIIYRKIPNSIVLIGLLSGFLLHLILTILLSDIIAFLIYCGILIVILISGIISWHLRYLTAGDVKLTLALVSLLPSFSIETSLVFLSATFIIGFFFLLFMIVRRMKIAYLRDALADTFDFKKIITIIISFFALLWLIQLLFNLLSLQVHYLIQLIIILFIYSVVRRMTKKIFFPLMALIAIIRVIIDPQLASSVHWVRFVFSISIFVIVRSIILELGEEAFRRKVSLQELLPGMSPVESPLVIEAGKDKNYSTVSLSLQTGPQGLSIEQIDKIHSLVPVKKQTKISLLIQETMPFAPFAFCGSIATIIYMISITL